MSDDFQYDKRVEMVALNEFMEQQQQKINQLQQEILLLTTEFSSKKKPPNPMHSTRFHEIGRAHV